MRIKKLELVGFKSFVDPTIIDFDSPIIGIVGPNGCGKSNVSDAIRWVMGEMSAKSLRGRSMEDVIFNGSEKRPALSFAEVSLTFSTEDGMAPVAYAGFSEITVTRRLYRSGESEYMINKVASRLRDVVELFLGTGIGHRAYSIIEQGKIDFVVNAKPEERRLLLEEAAGVSKFKARKEAALRKIEGTEQNLARLKDILQEVTRQINSLDRQVKKAERYKVLKNELRELELKLSALQFVELQEESKELKSLLDDWIVRETNSTAELSNLETDLEKNRLELTDRDQKYNAIQEKAFEIASRLQLLQAEDHFKKKEVDSLSQTVDATHQEITLIKGRLQNLSYDKEEHQTRQQTLVQEAQNFSVSLEEAERLWKSAEAVCEEKERNLDASRQGLQKIELEIQRLDTEKRLYEERVIAARGQIAKVETELSEDNRRRDGIRQSLQSKTQSLSESTEQCRLFHHQLGELKTQVTQKQEQKETLSSELRVHDEELLQKRSRLKSLLDLERNFEGYEEGVRLILQKKKETGSQPGIFGVVADLIETAPTYETAVSAALGEKLQYLIVKDHEEGIESIDYLKSQSSGRSSFIPLGVRPHTTDDFPQTQSGILGPLLNHVRIKEDYHQVAQYLFGDVVLVETLRDALTLWRSNGHQKTLVTLDGEVVDPHGVVSGGSNGISGKMLLEKKREIKELRTLCTELEDEQSLKEDSVSQLEGTLSELNLEYDNLLHRSREEEMKRMALGNEVQLSEEELRRIEALLEKLSSERQICLEELQKSEEHLRQGETHRAELGQKTEELHRTLQVQDSELIQSQHLSRSRHEQWTHLKIEASAMAERKLMMDRESKRLTEVESDLNHQIELKHSAISEAHQKIDSIKRSFDNTSAEITRLKKEGEEIIIRQEEAKKDYDLLTITIKDKEVRLRDVRKENDLAKSHTGDLRITLSRAETDLQHLDEKMVEKYSVHLAQSAAEYLPPRPLAGEDASLETPAFDREAAEQRIQELKERLQQIGEVNLGALSEYEELKTRQEFLTKQVQDLEESISALKKAIQKINQTTRQRFEDIFTKVNHRFQTLFPRLFHGGRAELRLIENEDLMNAGVELYVQPPGKKLAHIGLLSGGEKAMSAVAFVFSIFLVKPSPFCLLDEVDAPLDDVNTQRFHNLLSELTHQTQFILITHNRSTMEKCDLLYGVTMQEPGVSQLVSVRMNEAMKLAS